MFVKPLVRPLVALFVVVSCVTLAAQETPSDAPVRGSLIEDRTARKLLEAGNARYEADEVKKAVEIWESVIERYPRSPVRFQAHMQLGDFFLKRDRAYDKARVHFGQAASEENRSQQQRDRKSVV